MRHNFCSYTVVNWILSVSFFFVFFSSAAEAYCSRYDEVRSTNVVLPETIYVPRDAAVGSVFFTHVTPPLSPQGLIAQCDSSKNMHETRYWNQWPVDSSKVARTNVPGVGLRVTFFNTHETVVPSEVGVASNSELIVSPNSYWKIELIKTGTLSPGRLTQGTLTDWMFVNQSPTAYLARLNIKGGGYISHAACSVKQASIIVPLGKTDSRTFNGVGSTSQDIPFDIPLDCDAGKKINITLDAVTDSSGAPGVLALTPEANSASGVGIQIMSQGNPVIYGTPLLVGTPVADGPYNVSLMARYYQTEAKLVSGKANGIANFTMTYN